MPHSFFSTNHASESHLQETMGHEDAMLREASPPKRRPSLIGKLGGLLRRHHGEQQTEPDVGNGGGGLQESSVSEPPHLDINSLFPLNKKESSSTRSAKAVPSLPRPQTFRREQSEKRDRLLELPPERRDVSLDRRQRGFSASAASIPLSPEPRPAPSTSAPDISNPDEQPSLSPVKEYFKESSRDDLGQSDPYGSIIPTTELPNDIGDAIAIDDDDFEPEVDRDTLHEEYENRWILNLSMHFRDKSNREKFFVTYAETASVWRRVTVSLDYRDAIDGSLEADLTTLHYQRDKSFRIYEAIHESLPDIQYYDTVTNLKLTTEREDGQLHIHVREDANETIQYPPGSLFQHVRCPRYREAELEFESHISGFVYRVHVNDRLLVKKEIPGPDTVDEFFYEVNALDSLLGCDNVTQLQGLVTDDSGTVVKSLLISYASRGSLVDMLYDYAGSPELHWPRREKWAKQIISGLSEIHEAGFVQGDFTLSNIVIDADDNAQIIDINRRGCPVGWEPAELGRLIDSGQRIGMHISVKTDLFQLGMVLWALAEEVDEPEREERPLLQLQRGVPSYYREIVERCLCDRPQGRWSAARLLRLIPRDAGREPAVKLLEPSYSQLKTSDHSVSTHRSDKEYIDPAMAVTIGEIEERMERQRLRAGTDQEGFSSGKVTYVDPPSGRESTRYRFESDGSWVVGRRGRSPVSSRRRRSSPFGRTVASSATSLSPRSRTRSRSGRTFLEKRGVERRENLSRQGSPHPAKLEMDIIHPGEETSKPDASGNVAEGEAADETPKEEHVSAQQSDLLFNAPLHQDSGFDEKMIESLELSDPIDSLYYEAPAIHEMPVVEEEPVFNNTQLLESAEKLLNTDPGPDLLAKADPPAEVERDSIGHAHVLDLPQAASAIVEPCPSLPESLEAPPGPSETLPDPILPNHHRELQLI